MSGGSGRNFFTCDIGMFMGIFLALQEGGKVSTVGIHRNVILN